MSLASTDLQWQLVGRTNRFYQIRNKIRLTNDPFTNNSSYTKRNAGFIQQKAAAVKVNGKKGTLYVAVNDGTNPQKPAKMFKTVAPSGPKASEIAKIAAAVRPDQADLTFRRARKLQRTIAKTNKVRVARKGRSAKRTFKRTAKRPSRK